METMPENSGIRSFSESQSRKRERYHETTNDSMLRSCKMKMSVRAACEKDETTLRHHKSSTITPDRFLPSYSATNCSSKMLSSQLERHRLLRKMLDAEKIIRDNYITQELLTSPVNPCFETVKQLPLNRNIAMACLHRELGAVKPSPDRITMCDGSFPGSSFVGQFSQPDLYRSMLLRKIQLAQLCQGISSLPDVKLHPAVTASTTVPKQSYGIKKKGATVQGNHSCQEPDKPQSTPPVTLSSLEHGNKAVCQSISFPLSLDEDENWLSEFQCFVRSKLLTVVQANQEDLRERMSSKKILLNQVGIRCRFCSHLKHSDRIRRSSAFPSQIRQIYQSFTMMVRDHFGKCSAIPEDIRSEFLELKDRSAQGDVNSKEYWMYSAAKLGMVDTNNGIIINKGSISAALNMYPFGSCPGYESSSRPPVLLVSEEDRSLVPEFLYALTSHAEVIYLLPSERKGCRANFSIGTPGLGCRYCCNARRLGFGRTFPTGQRYLSVKLNDLFKHLQRCTLCPDDVKEQLCRLEKESKEDGSSTVSTVKNEKEFFQRIWRRLTGKDLSNV